MSILRLEQQRLLIQGRLDNKKTQAERNRLGQFSTPALLARDILHYGCSLLGKKKRIRFIDPAFGTGSFFSALLHIVPSTKIETAKGFELDLQYGSHASELWRQTPLDLELRDFTKATPPKEESDRYNLLICNPPYVRHHHLESSEKPRLQNLTQDIFGQRLSGLGGLYCYFLGLSHRWMRRDGIAGWLIPSEFMDVNYGEVVKNYLLEKVTLLRIHRFDPNDMQFDDALVSSAVVWFRNSPPSSATSDHQVEFTLGGSLLEPALSRRISLSALRREPKWSRFPAADVRTEDVKYQLSDFFTIKRGIATGNNKFFILRQEQIETLGLPWDVFRPILPSPRYIEGDEIFWGKDGRPQLARQLFLLDCRLSEEMVRAKYPPLWDYFESGKKDVAKRYLCRSRKIWYFQEERPPAPILCTYMGRNNSKSNRPIRFLLNQSQAVAANVYLLLYPKKHLSQAISNDPGLIRAIWQILNSLTPENLLGEGRVYGGGLHKLEPKELANVNAGAIAAIIPNLENRIKAKQLEIFE